MHEILDLIHHYGPLFYLVTFIWTALEGETFVIFAGLAAQRGLLNIEALFVAAWLGSMVGDQIYFFIGRRYGTRLLEKFPKMKPKCDKVFGWIERYAVIFILSYRFMYGIRNVSGVALGISHVPWKKFAFYNVFASALWALLFCGFGYLFGDVIARLGRGKDQTVHYGVREFMITALALFVAVIVIRWGIGLFQKKRAASRNDTAP